MRVFRSLLVVLSGALVGAVMLVVFAPSSSAVTAGVGISPASAAAGSTVTISGIFPPGSGVACPAGAVTPVSTASFFPPDGFGPVIRLAADGSFSMSYRVPSSTPSGTYSVGFRCAGGLVGLSASVRIFQGVPTPTTTPPRVTLPSQIVVPSGAPQAGFGGMSRNSHSSEGAWLAAGGVAVVVAASLATLSWRRRRA